MGTGAPQLRHGSRTSTRVRPAVRTEWSLIVVWLLAVAFGVVFWTVVGILVSGSL